MHVLIIPSWYPTHVSDIGGSFFREQALALHRHGCKVGIIYPQYRSMRQWRSIFSRKYGIEIEIDEGMQTLRFHRTNFFPRMPRLVRRMWLKDGLQLFEEYSRNFGRPDVIHAHCILNAGVLARQISLTYGVPFLVTEHSSGFALKNVAQRELLIAKQVANDSELNLAVSHAFAELLDGLICGKNKWQYLPNIVNKKFLTENIPDRSSKDFFFINVAFANDNKRQTVILSAFSNAFKLNPNVNLIFVGDGPQLESLKIEAKILEIEKNVEFTGTLSREQVLKKMSHSNAFVLSSRYETFGVVLVEALALGLPLIATRCGGSESIVNKKNGVLVDVDDVTGMARAMQQIYDDRENFNAKVLRDSCKADFGEEVISSKLCVEYERLIINFNFPDKNAN